MSRRIPKKLSSGNHSRSRITGMRLRTHDKKQRIETLNDSLASHDIPVINVKFFLLN